MPCNCKPSRHVTKHPTASSQETLEQSVNRLKAVLHQMDGETDATVQTTLDLYKLQAEQHQAEAAALREEAQLQTATAAARERDIELKWRRRLEEMQKSLSQEREKTETLERRLTSLTTTLEEEKDNRKKLESKLARAEMELESQRKRNEKSERALHQLVDEREWRTAALQWLRTELETSDEMMHSWKSINAKSIKLSSPLFDSPSKRTTNHPPHKNQQHVCFQDNEDANSNTEWRHRIQDTLRRYEEHQQEFKAMLAKLNLQRVGSCAHK